MSLRQGIVTAIDRANHRVRAVLEDGSQITAAYFAQRRWKAPWPLCTASFEQRGSSWMCTGPIGHHREIFHDDFLAAPTTTASAVPGTVMACDTPWFVISLTAGTAAQLSTADGQGVLNVTYLAGAADTVIRVAKGSGAIAASTGPSALWLAWRMQAPVLANNFACGGGVFDYTGDKGPGGLSGGSATIVIRPGSDPGFSAPYFRFRTLTGSPLFATDTVVQGVVPVAGQWYWCDLIVNDSFAAAWVDGDGPYVTTNVPPGAFSVILYSENEIKDVNRSSYYDQAQLHVVSVNDPTPLAIPVRGGLISRTPSIGDP